MYLYRTLSLATAATVIVTGSIARSVIGQTTTSLEVFAELQQPPGNLTVTPNGKLVMSLHQFYNPDYPVLSTTTAMYCLFYLPQKIA